MRRLLPLFWILLGFIGGYLARGRQRPVVSTPAVAPTVLVAPPSVTEGGDADKQPDLPSTREVAIEEVLALARAALENMTSNVDDYTAVMGKHEQDRNGVLQPPSEMFMKVMTRHRGGEPGQNLKAYLRFESPENVRGREVIWVEGENNGKLLVREAGLVGAMMTASVDPNGMMAMRGQRYPISELGLTNLITKLIEHGESIQSQLRSDAQTDGDAPTDGNAPTSGNNSQAVTVTMSTGLADQVDGQTLIQIQKTQPDGTEDDFSLAEVVIDLERQLVLEFRSFGWAEVESDPPPLIESYQYRDVKCNVGLTDDDFDTQNPEYTFKKT
ncbi:MAG: DUF1571 domain-containing protein [Planctomycetota bacterium]